MKVVDCFWAWLNLGRHVARMDEGGMVRRRSATRPAGRLYAVTRKGRKEVRAARHREGPAGEHRPGRGYQRSGGAFS
jgi:hypothetical protein